MNFKVSQLKSLGAGEVAVDDLIYVIDSNPTDGSVKSKKVSVGDLIDSRIYGISSSQFVLITGYYADPSWILSLDWSKIINAPSFVTSLSALTDVQLSTPLSGQALVYNGTKWVNQGIGELDTLNSVTTRGNTTTNSITVGSTFVVGDWTTRATNVYVRAATGGADERGYYIGVGSANNGNGGSLTYNPTTNLLSLRSPYNSGTISLSLEGNTNSVQFHNTSGTVVSKFVSSTGNLLIGTTTDSGFKLDVNGTGRISSSLQFGTSNTSYISSPATGVLSLNSNIGSGCAVDINGQYKFYYGQLQGGGSAYFTTYLSVGTTSNLGATLNIKGAGSTSATTSLLVQNSSGTSMLQVRDDNFTLIGPNGLAIDNFNCIIYRSSFNTQSISFHLSRLSFADSTGFVFSNAFSSTPAASAIFDIQSVAKGFLQPRMTNTQAVAITTPATGLQVYDTTNNKNLLYNGTLWQNIATETWVAGQGYLTTTPTLAQVTTAGNTTTNSISVGNIIASASNIASLTLLDTLQSYSWQIRNNGTNLLFVDGSGNNLFRLNSNGNVLIGTNTDAGYKLDVNGIARVVTRIDAGNFTPGAGASAYTFATMGQITAAGGYNLRPPTVGDSGFSGLGDSSGPTIYNNNATVARFNNIGGSLNGTNIDILQGYNPGAGTGSVVGVRHSYQLYPSADNTVSYTSFSSSPYWNSAPFYNRITGTIRGFYFANGLYNTQKLVDVIAFQSAGGRVLFEGELPSASAGISRGVYINQTHTAAANNDVLVGLDINPTFTNGAFTGVTNYGIRTSSDVLFSGNFIVGTSSYTPNDAGNVSYTVRSRTGIYVANTANNFGINYEGGRIYGNIGYGASNPTLTPAINVWTSNVRVNALSLRGTDGVFTGGINKFVAPEGGTDLTIIFAGSVSTSLVQGRVVAYGETHAPKKGALELYSGSDATYSNISFFTAGTEKIRIANTGNLLIGTTTDAGYKLDVNGITRLLGTTLINPQLNITAGTVSTQLRATAYTLQIRANDASVLSTEFFQTGNVAIGGGSDNGYKLDVTGIFGLGLAGGRLYSTVGNTLQANFGNAQFSVGSSGGESIDLGANSGGEIRFSTASVANRLVIKNNGNVLIGTGTDSGYKLDVLGATRTLASVENVFRVEHTNGNYATILFGNGSALAAGQFGMYFNGTGVWSATNNAFRVHSSNISVNNSLSTLQVIGGYGGSSLGTSIRLMSNTFNQGAFTATSGSQTTVIIGNGQNETWQPSSGNASYTLLAVVPVINTSGTYSGIVTGFAYNPTLTSITGVTHRAIHTVTGDVLLATTSGNVGIGTTSPVSKLNVYGGDIISSSATANRTTKLNDVGLYISRTSDGNYPCSITGDGGMIYDARNNHTFRSDATVLLDISNFYQNVTIGSVSNVALQARLSIKGSGSTSATSSLLIQNSSGSNALKITDDAQTFYYGTFNVTQTHHYSHNGGGAYRLSDSYEIVDFIRSYGNGYYLKGGYTNGYIFQVRDGFDSKLRFPLCVSANFNSPNASAILQADSTTQGFLPPRLTTAQINAITTPAEGLQVYNTDLHVICFYDGTAWRKVSHSTM